MNCIHEWRCALSSQAAPSRPTSPAAHWEHLAYFAIAMQNVRKKHEKQSKLLKNPLPDVQYMLFGEDMFLCHSSYWCVVRIHAQLSQQYNFERGWAKSTTMLCYAAPWCCIWRFLFVLFVQVWQIFIFQVFLRRNESIARVPIHQFKAGNYPTCATNSKLLCFRTKGAAMPHLSELINSNETNLLLNIPLLQHFQYRKNTARWLRSSLWTESWKLQLVKCVFRVVCLVFAYCKIKSMNWINYTEWIKLVLYGPILDIPWDLAWTLRRLQLTSTDVNSIEDNTCQQ